MVSNAPSAKNLRSEKTRNALLSAGFDLLADRPIDAIPIDDVVATAGVAKGSFFNHFDDKSGFAQAIAAEVRAEVEAMVNAANEGLTDPIARLAGGMRVAARFAGDHPRRAIVMLRGLDGSTLRDHPLNHGLRADIEAAVNAGLLRPEAAPSGMLFWLGLCQIVMVNSIERAASGKAARERLAQMLVMGLTGLGVDQARAEEESRRA